MHFLLPDNPESDRLLALHQSAELDPQSGKSIFLIWLLMLRLALGLPTGLQTDQDNAILFHEGGVSKFQHLNEPSHYEGLRFPMVESGFSSIPHVSLNRRQYSARVQALSLSLKRRLLARSVNAGPPKFWPYTST